MSVLAAFCDTFVYVCVKWTEAENKLEEIDEVGVQSVFSEVTDFNDLTRLQILSVCMYYKLSLSRGETDRQTERERGRGKCIAAVH